MLRPRHQSLARTRPSGAGWGWVRVLLGAGRPLLSSGSLAFAPWCPERASSWPSPWDLLSVPAPPPRGSANSRGCRGLPLPPACSAPQLRAPSQAWAEVAACDAHWVSNPQRDPNSLSASPVTLLSEPREAPSRGEDAVNVFLTRWVPCFVRRAGGGPSARSRRRPERGATVRPAPCSLSQGPHGGDDNSSFLSTAAPSTLLSGCTSGSGR